jgi:hypothetical protein
VHTRRTALKHDSQKRLTTYRNCVFNITCSNHIYDLVIAFNHKCAGNNIFGLLKRGMIRKRMTVLFAATRQTLNLAFQHSSDETNYHSGHIESLIRSLRY